MKVAFTTSGNNLDASLDSRFGRAPCFLIYDTERKDFRLIDNEQNLNAAQGAGIQAAETVVQAGVDCLITGHCGPKAFRVLNVAGVKIFNTDAPTLDAALQLFLSGKLKEAGSADVEGHWV